MKMVNPKLPLILSCYSKSFPAVWSGGGVERYQLNWPGKREALLTANAPIAKTLRPVRDESVHFDTTENLFIEGDNLDALKLLQETYLGKVKMIYIDPPYNTGKDFVYADDFAENTEDYLRRSNQKDEDGNRMEVNSESNGRFHSDWLSMMYPRLKLARNLLTDDGVIFISIDDNEQANLKRLCDEVFGEDNFVGDLIWQSATDNNPRQISIEHEYILCYAKNKDTLPIWLIESENAKKIEEQYNIIKGKFSSIEKQEEELKKWIKKNKEKLKGVTHYNNVDEKGVYSNSSNSSNTKPGGYMFDIIHPITGKPCPKPTFGWRWPEKTFLEYEKSGEVEWGIDETTQPHIIKRIETVKDQLKSVYYEDGRSGTKILETLFEAKKIFNNPKSVDLIGRLIKFTTQDKDDLILDFFAGSGTTAHSVIQLNAEDGGNRRFICVQLPEDLDEALKNATGKSKETIQNAIKWLDRHSKPRTIAEITKERIRRAADKIRSDFANKLPENWDGGFRVLRTDSSNMADVYYTPEETLKKMQQSQQDWLNQVSDNIKPDRTPEDLLFQVMLDWGVDLALPIEVKQIMGRTVFFVDGNTLIACFDKQAVDNDFITALTQYRPLRVVLRDDSFKDDAAKINTSQIFQQYSESTEVKTI